MRERRTGFRMRLEERRGNHFERKELLIVLLFFGEEKRKRRQKGEATALCSSSAMGGGGKGPGGGKEGRKRDGTFAEFKPSKERKEKRGCIKGREGSVIHHLNSLMSSWNEKGRKGGSLKKKGGSRNTSEGDLRKKSRKFIFLGGRGKTRKSS